MLLSGCNILIKTRNPKNLTLNSFLLLCHWHRKPCTRPVSLSAHISVTPAPTPALLRRNPLPLCTLPNPSAPRVVPGFGTASSGQASVPLSRPAVPPLDHGERPHTCPSERLTLCNYIIPCELFKVSLSHQTYTPCRKVPPVCLSRPPACPPQWLGYQTPDSDVEWVAGRQPDELQILQHGAARNSKWTVLARWKSYYMWNNPII